MPIAPIAVILSTVKDLLQNRRERKGWGRPFDGAQDDGGFFRKRVSGYVWLPSRLNVTFERAMCFRLIRDLGLW